MALETAEKYDVKIGKEIHAPLPIKPGTRVQPKTGMASALDFRMSEQIMELADRTGSKHVGLVPDFGIFQHSPSQVAIDYCKRHAKIKESIDFILEHSKEYELDDMIRVLGVGDRADVAAPFLSGSGRHDRYYPVYCQHSR